jgi:hypothetical protein
MTTRVVVKPGANRFAEDKEGARKIRLKKILPALDRGERVILDFRHASYATQSYIHALIGEALQKHRDSGLSLLEFKNCSAALKSVIELVVDYTLGGFPQESTSLKSKKRQRA